MTHKSLQLLAHYLNIYPQTGRVGDYGGTDKIGARVIKQMLSLDGVQVIVNNSSSGNLVDVNVVGAKSKRKVTYHVLDYDNGIDLMKPVKGEKFNGGICMDLLEHTENPFIIAENISNSLKKGAMLFVTVPWVWELHYHPKDYWRFAPQGLEQLFPKMDCLTVEIIRDEAPDETLPRSRLVGVFKKK